MADLIATCDPYVFIEDQREGYVRYRQVVVAEDPTSQPTRCWEVWGVCDGMGSCWAGAVNPRPTLDCPVTPELTCECRIKATDPLTFVELGLTDGN